MIKIKYVNLCLFAELDTAKLYNIDSHHHVSINMSPVQGLDEIDAFVQSNISAPQPEFYSSDAVPRTLNEQIIIESGLVEQVLAVVDGFSNETKATLTRQLSELNDDVSGQMNGDHVINVITTNALIEAPKETISHPANDELLAKITHYDPWYKQNGDPNADQRNDQITINDALLTDDINDTIYPSSWSEQPKSITFENSQEVQTQIYPEIEHSVDISISDDAVFSSDNQGVNSINITSIEIPGKMSLANVVALSPSQPSSIIVIENDVVEPDQSNSADDTQLAAVHIGSPKKEVRTDDHRQTFVTEIALDKRTNAFEKLPPHPPARIVDASAKKSQDLNAFHESTEQRVIHQRPPLERGKSHSEIPVLVRKTSIPTLPSLSTISPALSTSTSSLRGTPSKIPVFNAKSISPERESMPSLIGRPNGTGGAMSRSHSTLSARSSNPGPTLISVTSIKNSSRNPSGK